jgi:hypothetical protein
MTVHFLIHLKLSSRRNIISPAESSPLSATDRKLQVVKRYRNQCHFKIYINGSVLNYLSAETTTPFKKSIICSGQRWMFFASVSFTCNYIHVLYGSETWTLTMREECLFKTIWKHVDEHDLFSLI